MSGKNIILKFEHPAMPLIGALGRSMREKKRWRHLLRSGMVAL
jgi:hypothetical protein